MHYKTGIALSITTCCIIGLGIGVKANNEQPRMMTSLFMESSRNIVQKATTIDSKAMLDGDMNQSTLNLDTNNTNVSPQAQPNTTCPQNHLNCDGTHMQKQANCDGTHMQNQSNCDGTQRQLHRNGHNGNHSGNHE